MDIHYYIQNICDDISEDLKMKSSNYLCENQNYFLSSDYVEDAPEKDREHFLLELKIGDEVFIQRIFPAYWYHPKVRYTVDIRPNLKRILSDLTDILSSENLETTYLQYEL
jgi:spore coat polysaccharide biosynthesis protein SpsF (cytidylyltransferase family)